MDIINKTSIKGLDISTKAMWCKKGLVVLTLGLWDAGGDGGAGGGKGADRGWAARELSC